MGDRSNIVIASNDGTRVYLYAHWSGDDVLASALVGLNSGRTDDTPYLARIIFCDMVKNEKPGDETGFGISGFLSDNNYPILVLSENETGWFEDEDKNIISKVYGFSEIADNFTLLKENDSLDYANVIKSFEVRWNSF
jgi:hypothetical protein